MASAEAGERLRVQDLRAQIGHGRVQFFRRVINALDEAAAPRATSCRLNGASQNTSALLVKQRQGVGRRVDGDILVAEKSGLLDDENARRGKSDNLCRFSGSSSRFCRRPRAGFRDAADLHAREQHARARLEAADVGRVQAQFVRCRETGSCLC
jgi:hypothetical protein